MVPKTINPASAAYPILFQVHHSLCPQERLLNQSSFGGGDCSTPELAGYFSARGMTPFVCEATLHEICVCLTSSPKFPVFLDFSALQYLRKVNSLHSGAPRNAVMLSFYSATNSRLIQQCFTLMLNEDFGAFFPSSLGLRSNLTSSSSMSLDNSEAMALAGLQDPGTEKLYSFSFRAPSPNSKIVLQFRSVRRRRRRFTSFQPHQADQTMTHRK
jgi:hypothetical protein